MATTTTRRSGFLASVRRALAAIDAGFCKLNRIQFDAPWRTERRGRC
ncbi:MAG TPA: hypothetical protein VGB08_10115 [Allosphingosinicella sp.]|jgi:hypothetical protein